MPDSIAKWNGMAVADIAKINGIAVADIAKLNGIAWPTGAPPEYESVYPTQDTDHVKATSSLTGQYLPYFATDPTKSVLGSWDGNVCWLSGAGSNQRFHIDLSSIKIIKRIYIVNQHFNTYYLEYGAKNFTFWGSNDPDDFSDLTYANDGTWEPLTTDPSIIDQHTAVDEEDPQYFTVTNSTAYRYYSFKFADDYGGGFFGVRRIELQTYE
jgi:hypothetical protein